MREGEVFQMDEAVEEGAVREDVVVSFAFQSGEEPSEAK